MPAKQHKAQTIICLRMKHKKRNKNTTQHKKGKKKKNIKFQGKFLHNLIMFFFLAPVERFCLIFKENIIRWN